MYSTPSHTCALDPGASTNDGGARCAVETMIDVLEEDFEAAADDEDAADEEAMEALWPHISSTGEEVRGQGDDY